MRFLDEATTKDMHCKPEDHPRVFLLTSTHLSWPFLWDQERIATVCYQVEKRQEDGGSFDQTPEELRFHQKCAFQLGIEAGGGLPAGSKSWRVPGYLVDVYHPPSKYGEQKLSIIRNLWCAKCHSQVCQV